MRITAAEHRALDRKIRKRHAKLRKMYKGIRGKKVDWVEHNCEEGRLHVGVRFTAGTYFSLQFSPQIVTEGVEFLDPRTGDDEVLRVYRKALRQ